MALHNRCNTCVRAAGRSACGWLHFSVDSARPRTSRIGRSASRPRLVLHNGRRGLRPAACHIARGQSRDGYRCKARRSCCPRQGAGGRNACKARNRGVYGSAPCFSSAQSCGIDLDPCPRKVYRRLCPPRSGLARPCASSHRRDRTACDRAGVLPSRTWDTGLLHSARRSAAGSVAVRVCAPSRDPYTSSCRRLFVSRRVFGRPFDASRHTPRIEYGPARAKPHTSDKGPGRGAGRYDAGSIRDYADARSQDSHRPLAFSLSGLNSR